MLWKRILAFCLGMALMASSLPPSGGGEGLQVHTGELTAAQALASEDGWIAVPRSGLSAGPGPYWVRAWIRVPPRKPGAPAPVLALSLLGSWEAWWDNRPLCANGRVGASPSEETPGQLDMLIPIPTDQAAEGIHGLLLRVSSHHLGFKPASALHRLEVGEAHTLARARLRSLLPALCTLGALLLIGLLHVLRFLAGRRRAATLLLGLLCLAAAALLVLEAWRGLWDYAYPVHLLRLQLQTVAVLAIALLLPATMASAFAEPRRRALWAGMGLGLASAALIPGFDGKHVAALGWSLLLTTWLAVRAWRRGDAGALGALAGLGFALLLFFANPSGFMERGFFLAFGGLLGCLAAVHTHRERRSEEALEAATRISERLQLELLKRSLQPHFLMNTLGALAEVVEVEPAQASSFIAALGEAYRQLLAVVSERTISMGRELALVRAHLDLMGHRQGTAFALQVSGLDEGAPVPPAWLLTLLENAFSHNRYTQPAIFGLTEDRIGGRRRYTFIAPAGEGTVPILGEGTGSRYLKARLEEAFPGAWDLSDGATEAGWTTVVEVPA